MSQVKAKMNNGVHSLWLMVFNQALKVVTEILLALFNLRGESENKLSLANVDKDGCENRTI